jgi:hypothetical protein
VSGVAEEPWTSDPAPGWLEQVDRWAWEHAAEWEWRKHGSCPRCHHTMTVRVEASSGVFGDQMRPITVWCNCPTAHPGNPMPESQRRGCGQQGRIQPPVADQDNQ